MALVDSAVEGGTKVGSSIDSIQQALGAEADNLLKFSTPKIKKEQIHVPGSDWVKRIFEQTDRSPEVLKSLDALYGNGRLAGTGYLSILPVDQGIEHSAGASFAPNPSYFDGGKLVELAIEGGCNAIASTFGVLGSVARRYAHRIPFIVKLNHNELLTYPNQFDQILFGTVRQAWELGAVAVGATIYFGSAQSTRQLQEIAIAFHDGMRAAVLERLFREQRRMDAAVDHECAACTGGPADLVAAQGIECVNADADHVAR